MIDLRPREWRRWGDTLARRGLPTADDLSDHVRDAVEDHEPRSLGQGVSRYTRRTRGQDVSERRKVAVADSPGGRHVRHLGWIVNRPGLTIPSPDPTCEQKAAELVRLREQAPRGEIILLDDDELDRNL